MVKTFTECPVCFSRAIFTDYTGEAYCTRCADKK